MSKFLCYCGNGMNLSILPNDNVWDIIKDKDNDIERILEKEDIDFLMDYYILFSQMIKCPKCNRIYIERDEDGAYDVYIKDGHINFKT